MNRRQFLQSSTAALAAASLPLAAAAGTPAARPVNRSGTRIAAYYLGAHVYTCVPRHVRWDMEWMADKGTNLVCISVLEQDLFASYENLALIVAEAERVGMQVVAVPSRWAGLVAGAPKVPSLFSSLNPQTWVVNEKGSTRIASRSTGSVSSIHSPETLRFWCDTLAEMYRQHPTIAGFIIDEPKCFMVDRSRQAIAALGADAPVAAHLAATTDFFSRLCGFAKQKWPDKFTLMFQQAHLPAEELAAGAATNHLDYYGVDGRPWGLEDDARMKTTDVGQESGKGKVLLSGKGEAFNQTARAVPGRKSFFLAENHNLQTNMIEPLDRNYAAVLALKPDIFTYYFYPRNVSEPDRVMEIIGGHLKRFTGSA